MRRLLVALGVVLIGARLVVACIGWQSIPVGEAYRIETERCDGGESCKAQVDRKYGRWLNEGSYP